MTLSAARARARELAALVAQGGDPHHAKRERQEAEQQAAEQAQAARQAEQAAQETASVAFAGYI